jgi:hypothetical protein
MILVVWQELVVAPELGLKREQEQALKREQEAQLLER